ncbi:MAG TPA: N-acetylmuramoyl-L-alanine amidase, partial [Oceanipulchritudo sp.]|nr:N-acetylmuramoyl-L-alanine amidase [Oceanipulchritudo sp.]
SLTREQDVFISLEERGRQANRLKADLFVSLHFNALDNKSVSGVETYAFTPLNQPSSARSDLHSSDRETYAGQSDGPWSSLVAYYVQRSLVGALKSSDRGLKRARFTVLRDLEMPGLLVEGGFITSSTEGRNIGSAAYRDTMARAIVEGILVYKSTLDRLQEGTQR